MTNLNLIDQIDEIYYFVFSILKIKETRADAKEKIDSDSAELPRMWLYLLASERY